MRSSDVQMANAEAGDRDLVTDLSKKPQSSGCEIHPENIQVSRELQNLPGTSEPSKRQVSVMPSSISREWWQKVPEVCAAARIIGIFSTAPN